MDPSQRLEALLASGKDSALLRFGLGAGYLKAGDAERAAAHLKSAVEQDPRYSAAWKLLGKALEALGEAPAAVAAWRNGIAAAEKNGDKQAAREMAVFIKRIERAAPPSAS